jgi:hypothetical protein
MGVFSDLLANATAFDTNVPTTARDRVVVREIQDWIDRGDVTLPTALAARDAVLQVEQFDSDPSGGTFTLAITDLATGKVYTTAGIAYNANAATIESAIDVACSGIDEVQSIAAHVATVSGGTFALTINLTLGTFTTAGIAYNANAATIETAIDVAATAAGIVGWTNGDISVAGGDLVTTPVTLTYDGASVASLNQGAVTIDGALLTGGGSAGAVTTTTAGNSPIASWTNADISVSGGTLLAAGAAVVLTFDGASVTENNFTVTIDGAGLTGGGLASPATTVTTSGQNARNGWGGVVAMGLAAESDVPSQGVAPAAYTAPRSPGDVHYPSERTIRALADQAAIDDYNLVATRTEILAAAGLPEVRRGSV